MKLHLFNIEAGHLYKISGKANVEKFLKAHPNWRYADEEETEEIKDYFMKHGRLIASFAKRDILAVY